MKKYVTIALFIFWVVVTGLFVAGLLFSQKKDSPSLQDNSKVKNSLELNQIELSAHTIVDDCWLLISGKIYDVSGYLSSHPGGAEVIISACGKDATDTFVTKGGAQEDHSAFAYNLLSNYFVGNFGQVAALILPTSDNAATSTVGEQKTATSSSVQQAKPTTTNLSSAELAKHNSAADCWLLIGGRIYNVSSYLSSHPGGVGTVLPYCGREATNGFNNKGGEGAHSSFARSLLDNYFIGAIGQPAQSVKPTPAPAKAPSAVTPPALIPTVKPATVSLSSAELAKHNSRADCWLLISGKVYNVTNYINSHPGGAGSIINYCGVDGTSAFETKGGGGGNHSNFARTLLGNYYVGDLGQAIGQTQAQTAPPPPSGAQQNGDDEWEEDD